MDGNEEAGPGGFFALRTAPVPEGGHHALARLYAGEDAPLTGRIDTVAARLGTTERRVAASVAHLGLAARLWSTALGSAVVSGGVPALRAEDLHWDPGCPPRTTCGSTDGPCFRARRPGSGTSSSTAISSRSARRCAGTPPCRSGCCGATPDPRWREPFAN